MNGFYFIFLVVVVVVFCFIEIIKFSRTILFVACLSAEQSSYLLESIYEV